jgi:RNA polymerase sigma-70 factor, ECF subfamily
MAEREEQFLELRPLLFSLAYRMLGTRADTEDVVQEAFLRWQGAKETEIRTPRSYLTTIVARLSLDALKKAQRKREVYVGPWLPEPIVEPAGTHTMEMAESLSLAFLHVLERLSPSERVVFLLREIFEAPYIEVASILGITEANCRQMVTRARKRVRASHARFQVDREQHLGAMNSFLAACTSGDVLQLLRVLREDAVLYADGGGKVTAALNPIIGAERIARFFAGIGKKGHFAELRAQPAEVNGKPGTLIYEGDRLESVVSVQVDEDGRIAMIFLVVNPEKLVHTAKVAGAN